MPRHRPTSRVAVPYERQAYLTHFDAWCARQCERIRQAELPRSPLRTWEWEQGVAESHAVRVGATQLPPELELEEVRR